MTQLVPGDKVGMFSLVNPGRIPKFVIWGVGIFPFPAPTASWEYAFNWWIQQEEAKFENDLIKTFCTAQETLQQVNALQEALQNQDSLFIAERLVPWLQST